MSLDLAAIAAAIIAAALIFGIALGRAAARGDREMGKGRRR